MHLSPCSAFSELFAGVFAHDLCDLRAAPIIRPYAGGRAARAVGLIVAWLAGERPKSLPGMVDILGPAELSGESYSITSVR
jgi:hypothetical protein